MESSQVIDRIVEQVKEMISKDIENGTSVICRALRGEEFPRGQTRRQAQNGLPPQAEGHLSGDQ